MTWREESRHFRQRGVLILYFSVVLADYPDGWQTIATKCMLFECISRFETFFIFALCFCSSDAT